MDVNKRFDQLESLLVDLARKQDQQADQIKQLIAEVRRQGELLALQGEAISRIEQRLDGMDQRLDGMDQRIDRMGQRIDRIDQRIDRIEQRIDRIDQRLDGIGEQIDAIINIFKISEARHTQTEQRQEDMLGEIREQGRALNTQSQVIKEQGRRLDDALNVQLQMLHLMQAGNDKVNDLAQRLAPLEAQEPRLKRLEDEVFKPAS